MKIFTFNYPYLEYHPGSFAAVYQTLQVSGSTNHQRTIKIQLRFSKDYIISKQVSLSLTGGLRPELSSTSITVP